MKKVGLSILVLWIISSPAHAQLGISGGLMGGLNSASVSGADVSGDAKNLTGYAGGVFLGVNLPGPWAIEAEALYSMKGSKVPTASYTTTFDYRYLDIPVLLKYYLPIPVVRPYLFIGPLYSILLSAKQKSEGASIPTTEVDVKNVMSGSDVGAVVGAGVRFYVLRVEARYSLGLTTLDKSGTYDMYNRVAALYVGLEF